jgi:predicted Fe-Mo cluster-binding NifX family protein
MIERGTLSAGVPASTCCQAFRATGITAYLENGGTIENAHQRVQPGKARQQVQARHHRLMEALGRGEGIV